MTNRYKDEYEYILLIRDDSGDNVYYYTSPARYYYINGKDYWFNLSTSDLIDSSQVYKVFQIPDEKSDIWDFISLYSND